MVLKFHVGRSGALWNKSNFSYLESWIGKFKNTAWSPFFIRSIISTLIIFLKICSCLKAICYIWLQKIRSRQIETIPILFFGIFFFDRILHNFWKLVRLNKSNSFPDKLNIVFDDFVFFKFVWENSLKLSYNFSLPHFKIFETSIHNFWNILKNGTEPVDFQSLRVSVVGRKTQLLGKIFFLKKSPLESRSLRFRISVKNRFLS
jgi:hypothetical protein